MWTCLWNYLSIDAFMFMIKFDDMCLILTGFDI
jgi:hypothetical protein